MFEFLCLHNYIIVVLLSAHMAQLSEHWTSDQNVVGYNPGLCAWPIKCMCVWVGGEVVVLQGMKHRIMVTITG